MIVSLRIGNRKMQRDDVEEWRIAGLDAATAEVVADREAQLVTSDR